MLKTEAFTNKVKSNASLLIFIAWLVYTTSYLGKVNYSANITQIMTFYNVSKAEAGLVPTFFFFAYGIGQVVNGILCKYYNKKWFVFGTDQPITNFKIRDRKNKIAKEAGLHCIRVHDFRHSCASLLINNGANITVVAEYLGHSKIDETLNTYAHMYKSRLIDVVNSINKITFNA